MSTVRRARTVREVDYPTSDGKPMGETDFHRQEMFDVIEILEDHFAHDPMTYVSGNLLVFYEEGNRRKHISPDAFVARGVPKRPPRDYYLLWKEGKTPDLVIEITSRTTRREDQTKKWVLYRDVLKVAEYFQFDPTEDYLDPSLQGFRLVDGEFVSIAPDGAGRFPSQVLGLLLERDGKDLKFFDPVTRRWRQTARERLDDEMMARRLAEARRRDEEVARREAEAARRDEEAARREAEAARRDEEAARRDAEDALMRSEDARLQAEAEAETLRREVEALRRKLDQQG